MTLTAYNLWTNEPMRWVGLPLEFVDWMAGHFNGKLIQHLRHIDPYNSILIPTRVLDNPSEEFVEVQAFLKQLLRQRRGSDVPQRVDLYGEYGISGALRTTKELLEFFEFTSQTPCKIVSVGD